MHTQTETLAKVCLTRPAVAMSQIMEGDIEQSLSALRVYPRALEALHYADNATVKVKQSIEDHLEAVGIKWLT
jgi:hypothetical protein